MVKIEIEVEEKFEILDEKKEYYQIVDGDTIQSLIRYYKLEHDDHKQAKRELLRFVKDVGKGGGRDEGRRHASLERWRGRGKE